MGQDFLSKTSDAEKAILGGSLIVLVALFLPWYGWDISATFAGVTIASSSGSVDGFASWGWLTFLALLAVVFLWTARRFLTQQVRMPEMGVSDAALIMILGAVEVAGAVIFWLAYHSGVANLANEGVKFGAFVAIVGGALTIFGGYLMQDATAGARSPGALTPPDAPSGTPIA